MTLYNENSVSSKVIQVSAAAPCVHCGKPDWCYSVGELTVCKRGAEPTQGWVRTSKADKDGTPYYAPSSPKKAVRPQGRTEYFYPDRQGNLLIKVMRIDSGEGKKTFPQYHWNGKRWIKGVPSEIQKQVPVYRYQQVRKAIELGRPVFMVEGESCADALWNVGITATTTLGGSGKYRSYGNYVEDLAGADLVLCPDRDEPGVKHMEQVAHDYPNARWLYAPPGDFYWQHLAKTGGLDVGDWLVSGATADEVKAAVVDKTFGSPETPFVESYADTVDDAEGFHLTVPQPEEVFTQKACDALYGHSRYISLNGDLYRWTGTHYELGSTAAEKARIAKWCNSTPVESGKGWQYAYAKAHTVEAIWSWATIVFAVDPGRLNPPGLNCLNGILQISWQGNMPTWELVPHDPEILYTYVGEFNFNPEADPSSCDRLLECLEPDQREIFIRTLAASLDLKTIRRFKSRIRALLCKGDGNNGKDSLREVVQLLYGMGVVSATFNDFSQYENVGRKFTLAKLEQARVSWSSENSNANQLDKLQSLKAAITGETLDVELKNVNERPMNPRCIFLFNVNDMPNMQASLEAIQSRWAVLSFNKTFKVGADHRKGEIEADPRFRYDPGFLQREVVPALLNKMLSVLPEVATKSIDYSCTEQALQEVQRDVNHLRAFCQDVGLNYQFDGRIAIGELHKVLVQWYLDNGYLEITTNSKGEQKKEWNEPTRRGDRLVKSSKDVGQRFLELFPKAKREVDKTRQNGQPGVTYLLELGFSAEATAEALLRQKAFNNGHAEAAEALSPTSAQFLGKVESLLQESVKQMSLPERVSVIPHLLSLIDKFNNNELNYPKMPQLPQHAQPIRVECLSSASADASTVAQHKVTLTNSNSSAINSTITTPAVSSPSVEGVTTSGGHNAIGNIGNTTQNNSTKNFGRRKPKSKLKVGDKCKAGRPDRWSVPADKVLTIKNIDRDSEGDLAHVTFDGCRSITGSAVLLSDLYPVEDESIE